MTNALISTVVAAGATFIAAGLVIQFAVGSSKAAQQELRGGVKIDQEADLRQLIMYDSLIAYSCNDQAGGNLDSSGNKDWDDWKTYKDAAQVTDSDDFTFQNLNSSFRGDELGCYGTDVSIGGHGIINAISPSSREWRNDQEGEHSRIRFTVNTSGNSAPYGDPIEMDKCFWFDQSKNMESPNPANTDNPDKGWPPSGRGGLTDMYYYMTDGDETNSFDMSVTGNSMVNGCNKIQFNRMGGGSLNSLDGVHITVTWINEGSGGYKNLKTHQSSDTVGSNPHTDGYAGNRIPGPDTWSTHSDPLRYQYFKLCEGARGYIQTNSGYTDDQPSSSESANDGVAVQIAGGDDEDTNGKIDYESGPPYTGNALPGKSETEKFSDEDDDQDNSVHPVIVIESKGNCNP